MIKIIRTPKEIEELKNKLYDLKDRNKNPFFGMSFLDGIDLMLQWLTDKQFEGDPLSEE